MSAQPVDVLAVLEGVEREFRVRGLTNNDKEFADDFLRDYEMVADTRAAVAELIDALAAFDGMDRESIPGTPKNLRRLREAFARCGGGQ